MARLFISQERLDAWNLEEKVAIDGNVMVLLPDRQQLELTPAVRVMRVVSGESDPHGLCGCVKTTAEIASMGGEHYMDSLLVGEAAYDVQQGFVGEPRTRDRTTLDRLRVLVQSYL